MVPVTWLQKDGAGVVWCSDNLESVVTLAPVNIRTLNRNLGRMSPCLMGLFTLKSLR
jgi:hypothetical protein